MHPRLERLDQVDDAFAYSNIDVRHGIGWFGETIAIRPIIQGPAPA
jgi:hypothetical protein